MPAVFSVIGPVLNGVGGVVLIRVIIQNDERAEGHNILGAAPVFATPPWITSSRTLIPQTAPPHKQSVDHPVS
jgi:hypothetical protein